MNVYLVKRPDAELDFDENHQAVVIAASKAEALQMMVVARRNRTVTGDEDAEAWERAIVTKVRLDQPRIVLVDFHAG
jgi:hypothetical protein